MIIKYVANLTIEVTEKPQTEKEWEEFNIKLENEIESNLESTDYIQTAEIVIEEV